MRTSDTTSQSRLAAYFWIVRSPFFLLSLFSLLLNDQYLKGHYPGWFTGKLSDFAGLMLVALLAFSLSKRRTFVIGSLIASTFAWWKSPLSASFLDLINGFSAYQFGRVVDYSEIASRVVV
jgi:hypothetical protein